MFFFHLSHLIKLFLIRLVHYLSFVKSGKRFNFVQNDSCLFYQYFVFSYESYCVYKIDFIHGDVILFDSFYDVFINIQNIPKHIKILFL